jgi:hypothetical protein
VLFCGPYRSPGLTYGWTLGAIDSSQVGEIGTPPYHGRPGGMLIVVEEAGFVVWTYRPD